MIFENIIQFKKYASASISIDINSLEPYEDSVMSNYLLKWFSRPLIDSILALSASPEASIQAIAYKHFMRSLANFMIFEYTERGEVTISDLGIQRSENEQSKTAYANQVKKLAASSLEIGFSESGLLMDLMDINQPTFSEWANSQAYVLRSGLLVRSGSEMNSFRSITRPNHLFLELVSIFREIQDFEISEYITQDLLDEFITGGVTDTDKKLAIRYIKQALCTMVVAKAMTSRIVEIRGGSVCLIEETENTGNRIEKTPSAIVLSAQNRAENDTAIKYLQKARTLLIEKGFIIIPASEPSSRFIG